MAAAVGQYRLSITLSDKDRDILEARSKDAGVATATLARVILSRAMEELGSEGDLFFRVLMGRRGDATDATDPGSDQEALRRAVAGLEAPEPGTAVHASPKRSGRRSSKKTTKPRKSAVRASRKKGKAR